MLENNADTNSSPSPNSDSRGEYGEFLDRAEASENEGKHTEALLFYLTAFETASRDVENGSDELPPEHPAVEGLRCAWGISCTLDERSLAEYIFEKVQPYLTTEELGKYSTQLQSLALHKLEEFGLSREDVEDVADMISEDFFGPGGLNLDVTQLGKVSAPDTIVPPADDAAKSAQPAAAEETEDREPIVGNDTYDTLIGYDTAIAEMRRRGYGLSGDDDFNGFVKKINARHGIDKLPSLQTCLFRAPAREDADRLMFATVAEMNIPTIRMHMDENAQGVPVLCVMASPDFKSQMNLNLSHIEGSGVLVLEDIDLWGMPLGDGLMDDLENLTFSQLSRGARKAIVLIRSAVDNPDITVFASASSDSIIEDFMYELLEPIDVIDVAAPNVSERAVIWNDIVDSHSSLSALDRFDLVRLSANMSRYDIYMASREAIEEAYKASITTRDYVPVSKDNMFDKIAAYQPLDSDEYHQLEDTIIEDFRNDLEEFEKRFKGKA